jgi:hypothetical protein
VLIAEKERILEKQRVIEAKDDMIVGIRESSDIAKALTVVQIQSLSRNGVSAYMFSIF